MTTKAEDFAELVRLHQEYEAADKTANKAKHVVHDFARLFEVDISDAASDIVHDAKSDRLARYHRCWEAALAFNAKWGAK
jgi:hypothetical protein